jgi:hypothetical protein
MKIVVYIHRSRDGYYAAWTECRGQDTAWSEWCATQEHAEAQARESVLGTVAPDVQWEFVRKQRRRVQIF